MSIVTICIPTYNNLDKLMALIDSIKIQTYKDYDIVITDNSEDEQIEKYVSSLIDEPITYLRHTTNIGPVLNWNKSLQMATGKYIKIMFADDWFSYPDSLEKFVATIEKNTAVDFVFSGTWQMGEKEQYSRKISEENFCFIQKDIRNLYIGNYIGAPSATIFRNKQIMFDDNLKWLVDLELYMRILKNGGTCIAISEPLVSIGINEKQLTNGCVNNYKLQVREYSYILKKHQLWKKVIYVKRFVEILATPMRKSILFLYVAISKILKKAGLKR